MTFDFLLIIVLLIFSIIVHEVSHGLMALRLGDPTAKYAGRLTLNPISHIDPIGSLFLPFLFTIIPLIFPNVRPLMIGWAKPVPYNPYNLSDQKYGPAMVGLAGPLSNLVLALIAGLAIRILGNGNIDSSSLLMHLWGALVFVNVSLLVFNLIPIPPLDGSKALFAFLPISEHTKMSLEQNGMIFLIAFVYLFSGLIQYLIVFVLSLFSQLVIGDLVLFDILREMRIFG